MKKIIAVCAVVLLPLLFVLHVAPVRLPKAEPTPTAKPIPKSGFLILPRVQYGPLAKGKKFMADYIVTDAADAGANQIYSAGSFPFTGLSDSGYSLTDEGGGVLFGIRHGSTRLYLRSGTLVGFYANDPVDNAGDVSTPEVAVYVAPSSGGAAGMLLKFKGQQGG